MSKEKRLIERNIELSAEFSRYIFEHPEIEGKIPIDAEIILLPEFDEELKEFNLELGKKLEAEGSELVKTFPKNEKYDLVSQTRRSARSIPSDISEGFGRFHFNDKLTFYERARASLGELRNHFMEASGNSYIDKVTYDRYRIKISEVGFLLNRMIRNVRIYRDNHKFVKKAYSHSSRRLTSNAKQ